MRARQVGLIKQGFVRSATNGFASLKTKNDLNIEICSYNTKTRSPEY